MAKLATIQHANMGNVIITHTELPPLPESPSKRSPTKQVLSSPHKPYTSTNFYDLTKSSSFDDSICSIAPPSEDSILLITPPRSPVKEKRHVIDLCQSPSIESRVLQEMDTSNVSRPMAQPQKPTTSASASGSSIKTSQESLESTKTSSWLIRRVVDYSLSLHRSRRTSSFQLSLMEIIKSLCSETKLERFRWALVSLKRHCFQGNQCTIQVLNA